MHAPPPRPVPRAASSPPLDAAGRRRARTSGSWRRLAAAPVAATTHRRGTVASSHRRPAVLRHPTSRGRSFSVGSSQLLGVTERPNLLSLLWRQLAWQLAAGD